MSEQVFSNFKTLNSTLKILKDLNYNDIFNLQALLVFCIIWLIWKFINPIIKLRFYNQQELQTEFFPIVSSSLFKACLSSKIHHNYALIGLKALAQKKPNLKAIVRTTGSIPVVILLDPDLEKDFLAKHDFYSIENTFGDFSYVFSKGISAVKGYRWEKQRRILSQSLNFEFLRENIPLIQKNAREMIESIFIKDLKSQPVDIIREMQKIVGENISKIFFKETLEEYAINGESVVLHLINILRNLTKTCTSFSYLAFGIKFIEMGLFKSHKLLMDDLGKLERTLRRVLIDRKNQNVNQKDLAWFLLESQHSPAKEFQISDEEIIANFATLIQEGAMNTSCLIAMALFELSRNPEILEKLNQEIITIYDKEENISLECLDKMEWLFAIIKEILRMYNPEIFKTRFRQAYVANTIGNINVKKGTFVGAFHGYSSLNPNFFENPLTFSPWRWVNKQHIKENMAYDPFLAGPRSCIGQYLALIMARLILIEFIKSFNFNLIPEYMFKIDQKNDIGPMDCLYMNLTLKNSANK